MMIRCNKLSLGGGGGGGGELRTSIMKNAICETMDEQLEKKKKCMFWVNLSLNGLFNYPFI